MFAYNLKQIIQNKNDTIRKASLRLQMAIRNEDYDRVMLLSEEMSKYLDRMVNGYDG